ncbi:MAG: FAD-dependent oxidoreductase [Elusimicrobia bacterium]|nr:FAD-dependent oxidoreductase [Candidatus Liberimonas magnetica]
MRYEYHVIVIGAGSAGLSVASGCAAFGAKTALIEKDKMGGECLNDGCVPSKAFLKCARIAGDIKNSQEFGIATGGVKTDLKTVIARVSSVIGSIAPHDSKERFESLGVDVIKAQASFVDAHTVKAGEKTITGKYIVIASGSVPLVPQTPGLKDVPYLTNKNIFELEVLPKHLIVLGGGPIGLELSQGFRSLGSEVTVIDKLAHLFPKDDPEVAPLMEKKLHSEGIALKLSSKIVEVRGKAGEVSVITEKDGVKEEIKGDGLLLALGRAADNNGLNLDKAGVMTDNRGYIIADEKLRTNIKNIYACGDSTGLYQFTHMAGYQAELVVRNIIFPFSSKADYSCVPWAAYTKPEVAHVGYTEPWAKSLGVFGYSAMMDLGETDRAKTEKDEAGFIKLIVGKNKKIIGVTLVGERASEMIGLGILAVKKKLRPADLRSLIFCYPTESEIYKLVSDKILRGSFKPWMKTLVKKLFI